MTAAPEWVNARDFASIQAAVDSLGVLHVSSADSVRVWSGCSKLLKAYDTLASATSRAVSRWLTWSKNVVVSAVLKSRVIPTVASLSE